MIDGRRSDGQHHIANPAAAAVSVLAHIKMLEFCRLIVAVPEPERSAGFDESDCVNVNTKYIADLLNQNTEAV